MSIIKLIFKTTIFSVMVASSLTLPVQADSGSNETLKQESVKRFDAFDVNVIGKGKPVLLIPGVSSSSAVWTSTIAALKDNYQLHIFNLAGFAGVPAPSNEKIGRSYLTYQKRAITKYIKHHVLKDVVVIGHSLGGFLAMSLATENNPSIIAVINIDGLPALGALFANMPKSDKPPVFDPAAMAKSMANNIQWHERILEDMQKSDPMTSGRAMTELIQQDIRTQLNQVTIPILTIGAPAQGLPFTSIEQSKQNYRAQLKNIPKKYNEIAFADKAKHFIMADEPKWMNFQIQQFLSRL